MIFGMKSEKVMADTNYKKPTLQELNTRAKSEITGAGSGLRFSLLVVISRIVAGAVYEVLRYVDYVAKQIKILTADEETLISWGRMFNVPRKSPTFSTGDIHFSGTPGTIVAQGTEVRREDGEIFISTEAAEGGEDGGIIIHVKAKNVGLSGNTEGGTSFKFVSPIAGIKNEGTAASEGLRGGFDLEKIESWRSRILERARTTPMNGSLADYVIWAKEVTGVTRAWSYSGEMGKGTVTVRFMMDDAYQDGIPQTTDIKKVLDYISAPSRKPATADVYVVAPKAVSNNIIISELNPNTPEVKQAVINELKELYGGVTETGGIIYLSQIDKAISTATGEISHKTVFPTDNIVLNVGEIPVLGEIIFNE